MIQLNTLGLLLRRTLKFVTTVISFFCVFMWIQFSVFRHFYHQQPCVGDLAPDKLMVATHQEPITQSTA